MNQTQLAVPAPRHPLAPELSPRATAQPAELPTSAPAAELSSRGAVAPAVATASPAAPAARRTDDLLIRRAVADDRCKLSAMLDGLSELSLYFRFQTAVGHPPRAALIEPLLSSSGESWVAERNNHLVAHAMWAWAYGTTDTPTAELAAIVADPYQGRGLGTRMLDLAGAQARAAGARQLLLVVSAANDRTLRLIRRRWPTAPAERDGPLINFTIPT